MQRAGPEMLRCWAIAVGLSCLGMTSRGLAQERPREVGDAIDVWSEPNPGIRYLDRRMTTPCRVHAVSEGAVVDDRTVRRRVLHERSEDFRSECG